MGHIAWYGRDFFSSANNIDDKTMIKLIVGEDEDDAPPLLIIRTDEDDAPNDKGTATDKIGDDVPSSSPCRYGREGKSNGGKIPISCRRK